MRRQQLWLRLDTLIKHQPSKPIQEQTEMYNLNDAEKQTTFGPIPPGIYRTKIKIKSGSIGDGGFLTLARNFRTCHLNIELIVTSPAEQKDRRVWDIITVEVDESDDDSGMLPPVDEEQLKKYRTAVRLGLSRLRALIESAHEIDPDDKSERAQKLREIDITQLNGVTPTIKAGIKKGTDGHADRNTVLYYVTCDMPEWPKSGPAAPPPVPPAPPLPAPTLRAELDDEIPF